MAQDKNAAEVISMSRPSVGEAGKTGDWRSKHPVLDPVTCSAAKQGKESCQFCWAYCPDACISRGAPPVIDLTFCKGCGICSQECPTGSITMESETEPGACEIDAAESIGTL